MRKRVSILLIAFLGLSAILLAQANSATNEGTSLWTNVVSFIIGVIATFIVQVIKPEWFGEWITKLIESKMTKKNANIITNSMAFLCGKLSVFFFDAIPDDNDLIKQGVAKMKEGLDLIKKGLSFLK